MTRSAKGAMDNVRTNWKDADFGEISDGLKGRSKLTLVGDF